MKKHNIFPVEIYTFENTDLVDLTLDALDPIERVSLIFLHQSRQPEVTCTLFRSSNLCLTGFIRVWIRYKRQKSMRCMGGLRFLLLGVTYHSLRAADAINHTDTPYLIGLGSTASLRVILRCFRTPAGHVPSIRWK